MTQFAKLSVEAFKTVNNFFHNNKGGYIFCEPNKQLMVSLYSLLPNANAKVLDILGEHLISLDNYLSSDEITMLQNEYTAVIQYCCKYSDYSSTRGYFKSPGYTHLPTSLVELCVSIASPENGKNVYLPYAGEGLFASCCKDCNVDGFEKDPTAWAISQILATASNSVVNVECGDFTPIANQNNAKKYDYIFSFPPMLPGNASRQIVDTLYQLITNQLSENGELYAILPMSFCNASSGWFDLRKIVYDYQKDISVMVIALPAMLQPVTSVPLCLVSFFKSNKGIVVLADATGEEFFSRQEIAGVKDYTLKVQSVVETIKTQDEKYVWVGHVNDLDDSLNMTPSRYLLDQVLPKAKNGENYIKVKDLIKIIPTTNTARTNEMQAVVGMKELSFNYLNCDIRYQDIPKVQANFSGRTISEKALLVGFIGGKFKVGRLVENLNKQPITLRPEIIPFEIKSDSITEDFFLRAIMSELSELQGKAMSSGVTITRLHKEDFLEMRILVPSLIEQQEELCKQDTRESLTESDRKILESYEDFRKDVHMKKHAIGQTLANFKNWWKLLDQVRNSGNGIIDENAVIGRIHKVSVKEIFDNLESSVSKLTTQLNKFDTGYGLVKEEFALTEFIEKYIQKNRSPLFRFEYNEAEHRSSEDIPEIDFDQELNGKLTGKFILKQGDPIEYVKFPKGALTKIFDNIVSNACAHGFVGREEANNIIKIDIDNVGSDYIVSISNNGEPLDRGMKCEEITIYGQTSGDTNKHFGIGGYEIKRLMEEFGDSLEIISDPNAEFTVTYKLIFHDTNITSSFSL